MASTSASRMMKKGKGKISLESTAYSESFSVKLYPQIGLKSLPKMCALQKQKLETSISLTGTVAQAAAGYSPWA